MNSPNFTDFRIVMNCWKLVGTQNLSAFEYELSLEEIFKLFINTESSFTIPKESLKGFWTAIKSKIKASMCKDLIILKPINHEVAEKA